MNRYYKPYDCDLREYEARLASSREIWDDYSHEWTYSAFDEKIVILAGFVLKGGDMKRAIERYAEDRSEIYRCRIHWVIFNPNRSLDRLFNLFTFFSGLFMPSQHFFRHLGHILVLNCHAQISSTRSTGAWDE